VFDNRIGKSKSMKNQFQNVKDRFHQRIPEKKNIFQKRNFEIQKRYSEIQKSVPKFQTHKHISEKEFQNVF